jgi:biopolymer transport protein ExbB/TolQ
MIFADTGGIEQVLFDISDALRVPVLVITLIALAAVLVEFGAMIGELLRRRRRSRPALENAIVEAKTRMRQGDLIGATGYAAQVAWSKKMAQTMASIVELVPEPDAEPRIAKQLADFDYLCIKRLERSRILVRLGPAFGLMGTLIPLSPALAGLANGDVQELTDNLQVAFSVTVTGLLVGVLAFVISLTRDRLYGQDFSDAEYFASAVIGTPVPPGAMTRAQAAAAQAQQAAQQPQQPAQPAQPGQAAPGQPGQVPTGTPPTPAQPGSHPTPSPSPANPGTTPTADPNAPTVAQPGTPPATPPNPPGTPGQ